MGTTLCEYPMICGASWHSPPSQGSAHSSRTARSSRVTDGTVNVLEYLYWDELPLYSGGE